jgi:hypothetical protein
MKKFAFAFTLVCLPFTAVLAQTFGPCNVTAPAVITNTIACTWAPLRRGGVCNCTGSMNINVQQYACANVDSTSCLEVPSDLVIVVPPKSNGCRVGGLPSGSGCLGSCVSDWAAAIHVGGGKDC